MKTILLNRPIKLKHCFLTVFLLLSISALWTSISQARHPSLSDHSINNIPPGRQLAGIAEIKFFGFYGSAMDGLPDATAEIAPFANVSWIAGGADPLPRIENAKQYNLRVILDVMGYFFDQNFRILPDYGQRWSALASSIAPYVQDGTLVAFYPMDEPFGGRLTRSGLSKKQMRDQLELVGNAIKGTFPSAALAVILGGNQWDNYLVPRNFDWIGFDAYDCWDDCGGHSVPDTHANLVANLTSPNQRTILVPDTWRKSLDDPSPAQVDEMIELFNRYVEFAKTHPIVIGMFNFIYQDLPRKENHIPIGGMFPGLNRIPRLKQRVADFGARIKANTPNDGHSGPGTPEHPPVSTLPSKLVFAPGTLTLNENQAIETANHKLVMQGDGNLVLYRKSDNKAQWASNTNNKCSAKPCWMAFQANGNLVIYQADGKRVWDTKTVGSARLVLRDEAPFLRIMGSDGSQRWP